MAKYLVIAVILVGGLGAAYYFTSGYQKEGSGAQASSENQNTPDTVTWQFDEAPEKDGVPQTTVSIEYEGTLHTLGTFEGNCTNIEASSWQKVEGELTAAICWFAGGGTELAVFSESGSLVVKKGVLEEGTAEGGSVRGNFEALITL